ncbi:MAG: putative Ig domain-containing protein [Acidimicrobiales bacterium]
MNNRMQVATTHSAPRIRRLARWAGVAAGGALALTITLVSVGATAASASTLNGAATPANPATQAPLGSAGSATPFTVTLPANAACSGDTATDGYHVYSYLVPLGTALSGVTFVNFPSTGYGFVDNTGLYYGPANTAIGTGQIVSIPDNFEWAPLVADDGVPLSTLLYSNGGTSGAWEAGLACANTHGTLTDNWNTEVDFITNPSDPHGFSWSAVPGAPTTLRLLTRTVPPATRGTPFSFQLQVAGGVSPYKWKATGAPKGIKLGKTGLLAGTLSTTKIKAGTYPITVTVSDSGKKSAKQTTTLVIDLVVS